MKILIFGDIYGRMGRKAFSREYDVLMDKYSPDFSVVNIENITSGRGPVTKHAEFIESHGVDIMTLGDHSFDNRPNIDEYFAKNTEKIIRPANFQDSPGYKLPGLGYKILEKNGKRLLVVQLLGEVFMNHKVRNPFIEIEKILKEIPLSSYDVFILDFHRETTAELYGMGRLLDGRAGLVYGTHTHIQTNDAHIMPSGTGIITDVGMNGPFDGVIGAEFSSVKKRFFTGISRGKIEQKLTGKYVINALLVEIDEDSGLCQSIENISYTGTL